MCVMICWYCCSEAIVNEDQVAATEEKTKLEEAQRAGHKERKETGTEWVTKHFEHEGLTFNVDGTPLDVPKYSYKNADVRPWDGRNDLYQYENNYTVCTKTRHKTPMIRTQSIVSVLDADKVQFVASQYITGKHLLTVFNIFSRRMSEFRASAAGRRVEGR